MSDNASNSSQFPGTVAAVDLGSNSFHMIVADVDENGHLQVVDRMREMVRLAGGLDEKKNLSAEAMERALACLSRFGQRLRSLPQGAVRAVGTNTLRLVRDSNAFIRQAQAALGHPIEVIAGREEARLVYLGVAHGLASKDERRLVVDIGGGSTELIVGEGFNPLKRESLEMGCVNMSRAFFDDGKITPARMHKADTACALELRPVKMGFRAAEWQMAVGSSGTIKAIRDVVVAEGWSTEGITFSALKMLRKALIEYGEVDKIGFSALGEDRKPVFVGGVAVLYSVFKALMIEQMMVSDLALREGLLYDMLGRKRDEDVRDRTVVALAQRYGVDVEHARRVENTARAMLSQTLSSWTYNGSDYNDLLGWACTLHEVGLLISHSQYQKHGAYIIENADMAGFTRQEQAVISSLIRSQRRKVQLDVFEALPEALRESALRLCVLLRLAVLLHRSRSASNKPNPILAIEEQTLRITFPEGWLEAHPLARAELKEEAKRLKSAKLKLKYKD